MMAVSVVVEAAVVPHDVAALIEIVDRNRIFPDLAAHADMRALTVIEDAGALLSGDHPSCDVGKRSPCMGFHYSPLFLSTLFCLCKIRSRNASYRGAFAGFQQFRRLACILLRCRHVDSPRVWPQGMPAAVVITS